MIFLENSLLWLEMRCFMYTMILKNLFWIWRNALSNVSCSPVNYSICLYILFRTKVLNLLCFKISNLNSRKSFLLLVDEVERRVKSFWASCVLLIVGRGRIKGKLWWGPEVLYFSPTEVKGTFRSLWKLSEFYR